MPEIRKARVFDGKGNLVAEETYEMGDDTLRREQAQATIARLKAKGKANWTSGDQKDALEALMELYG